MLFTSDIRLPLDGLTLNGGMFSAYGQQGPIKRLFPYRGEITYGTTAHRLLKNGLQRSCSYILLVRLNSCQFIPGCAVEARCCPVSSVGS